MKPAGLTLVELLVVLSIAAFLAALLFPAFHNSREQARATTCEARVRQLAFTLHAYEGDNQSFPHGFGGPGKAPPPGGYPGSATIDPVGWWWFNFIDAVHYKTARDRDALRCPSKRLEDTTLKRDILCGNYGVNRAICKTACGGTPGNEFEGTPLSIGAIRHPAMTVLVMDSGYSLICWWHAAKAPPVTFGSSIQDTAYVPGLEINGQKTLWPGQKRDAIGGRHPNQTVNIAFADAHVERRKARDLLVPETDAGGWDYSPLWSPE
jgi:prepilin-type processing-associated H-X9-DG protein/prepilin-type N-terminal cleavage/methylation domain-containing protein